MNDSRIYDISPLISSRLGVFPGDTPFRREIAMDFEKGDHLLLSSIQSTLHIGAHADGPNHYVASGSAIHERPLKMYMGRCLVLHSHAPKGVRIQKGHLSEKWRLTHGWPATRILVSTKSFPDPEKWNSDFSSFDPELIEEWAKAGVRLIGIDTPSIDPEDAKELLSHKMVAQYDLAVLEGLVLDHVPEGLYTLIALPLKIEGADAAPVRAVLVDGPDRLEVL